MPSQRRKQYDEPEAILTGRKQSDLREADSLDLQAVALIALGAIQEGSSVYISPGRYGSVTVKVYIDGKSYAETLNPGDSWPDMGEQICEALWDKSVVSRLRKVSAAWRNGTASAAREPGKAGSG